VWRGRPHDDAPRAAVDGPLQLGDRPIDIAQRQIGRGVDAVAVVAAPVLVEPTVERGERERDRTDVVLQQLFVEHAEGGKHPYGFEAELIELRDARVAVAVLGGDGLALDQEFPGLLALRVSPEVVVHRPGLGDRVEGRVHDGPAHLTAHDVVPAAADLCPLHAARSELRVEMTRKGVERFVVVVVGVERPIGKLAHEMGG
jgi:hypothetical protein